MIVTGDTKVVDTGAADGLYITTAGIGLIPAGRHLGADRVRPGDVVLVSGTLGDHGVAVMLARGDLDLEADVQSDTAPLVDLVELLLAAAPGTRWLRDPTRGGVATVCNELAADAEVAVVLEESALPLHRPVVGACDLLGIDPLYFANEGKLIAVVPPDQAAAALQTFAATHWARRRRPSGGSRQSRNGSCCWRRPSEEPASWTCSWATRCRASADPGSRLFRASDLCLPAESDPSGVL